MGNLLTICITGLPWCTILTIIVLTVLITLFLQCLARKLFCKGCSSASAGKKPAKSKSAKTRKPTEEEVAAIVMALRLSKAETQPTASAAMPPTSRVTATGASPWNSKILTLTQQPNKR